MRIHRKLLGQIDSRKFALLAACMMMAGCGGGGSSDPAPTPTPTCSVSQIETDMDNILSQVTTDADFSFVVERQDGRRYSYNRGASTLQTSYESASTSKLVTSVIIMRLVERGYLNLTDRPQDRIANWPISSTDPLYNMTLAQLLSFTAGMPTEPACLNAGFANFENCVNSIATANANNGIAPGQEFYYASTYMQVAGLMAIKARGVATWQDLFSEFKTQTGLFPTGAYDLPSASNPRLAGGMHWTGEEYMNFLTALKKGLLLNSASMSQLLADHTVGVTMANSPSITDFGEEWHYGLGLWQECQSPTYNCTPGTRVSSPGSYGAYPYWDITKNYTGMLARQGALQTFPNGAAVERAVRPTVEEWVACQ